MNSEMQINLNMKGFLECMKEMVRTTVQEEISKLYLNISTEPSYYDDSKQVYVELHHEGECISQESFCT